MENGMSQDITRQQAAVPRPREAEIVERITFLCWLRPRVFAKHIENSSLQHSESNFILLMDVICNMCDGDSNFRWSCFSGLTLTAG